MKILKWKVTEGVPNNATRDASSRERWVDERAYRTGVGLTWVSFGLCSIALIMNLKFAGLLEQLADLGFLAGCILSLYLTKKQKPRRHFVWWPLYLGILIAIVPSTWLSGGLYSPWLGLYIATIIVLSTVVQTKISPLLNLGFISVYVAAWIFAADYIPREQAIAYIEKFPPHFMFIGVLICTSGISYCLSKLMKTEKELTQEIETKYAELFEARASLLREESANQAKSTFLANISHELRTPLGAVLGYANLLQDKSATPEEKAQFAQTIERNGQQLARLVDDLLDLSKIEAGRIELEKLECKVPELISEVMNLLMINAKKKNIPLKVNFESEVPEIICTDPVRFKQILTNIVGNALKFTEAGLIRVDLNFLPALSQLTISIKDSGRGITEAERAKLFKPFSQADASMTRRYGGTGLGLNFSRELSRLLGGELELKWSELGKGSEFFIRLPVDVPAGTAMLKEYIDPLRKFKRASSVEPNFDFHGVKVLVVDDAPENRDIVQRYLLPTGAEVDVAADGNECLTKTEVQTYDIVLMDIQMPGLDGLQATNLLRKRQFTAPIIAITAHAMREDRDRCLEAGCNNHIAKPLKKLELMEVIQKYRPGKACTPPGEQFFT